MDPVSYVFSAYLNSVQTTVQDQVTQAYDTQISPVTIQYEGTNIEFQHQLWRVRDNSVCGNMSDKLTAFSDCTVKASKMFHELCSELSKTPTESWRHRKFQEMYCNAALSFKPTIARISAGSDETKLQKARQACNAATVAALGSSDTQILGKRERLCKVYQRLKRRPGTLGIVACTEK